MTRIIISAFFVLSAMAAAFPTVSGQDIMEKRLAAYDQEFTNCDAMDVSKSNQIHDLLLLNPGPDAKSLRLIGSGLKRTRQLQLTNFKDHVRDLVDVLIDPSYIGNSDLQRQMKISRHLALLAFAVMADADSDADILYSWFSHRNLDDVSEYLIARILRDMKKNPKAVKAVNSMLELLGSKDRKLSEEAFVYTLLDAVENQGSRSSISKLFLVEKKFGNSKEVRERISAIVGNLSTYGTN